LEKDKEIMLTDVFLSIFLFVLAEDVKAEFEQIWQMVFGFHWDISFCRGLLFGEVHDWSNQ